MSAFFFAINSMLTSTVGLIATWVGVVLSIDKFHDCVRRSSSQELYGESLSHFAKPPEFCGATKNCEDLFDSLFSRGSYFRPSLKRSSIYSLICMFLGAIASSYYYVSAGEVYPGFYIPPWILAIFACLLLFNIIGDFFCLWITRACLSHIKSIQSGLFLSLLDGILSAALSPALCLTAMILVGMFISVPPPSIEGLVELEITEEITGEKITLLTFADPGTPTIEPAARTSVQTERLHLPSLQVTGGASLFEPDAEFENRSYILGLALKHGTIADAILGHPYFVMTHTGHRHYYQILFASLFVGSLVSSLSTSFAIWGVYFSALFKWMVHCFVMPVRVASKYLDIGVEKIPLGSVVLIYGALYIGLNMVFCR